MISDNLSHDVDVTEPFADWEEWDKQRILSKGRQLAEDLDWDVAASVQLVFTDIVLNLANWLFKETGKINLAYSGGCALNCVTNSSLIRNTLFNDISIQPAAGDAGASLGAAALIERRLWENAFLGYEDYEHLSADETSDKIIKGNIIPIIHGRAEFGPRALGNRSLLCAPINSTIAR